MSTFLPEGYEISKKEKKYWKLSEMKDGDNRLRIVMKPIVGWLDWQDKKPIRYRPDEKPRFSFDPDKPAKIFWDLYVWDYAREGLYILEITQGGVIKALISFAEDGDWGDFTQYDLKINKQGSGKDTRYTLTPLPVKPLAQKILDDLEANPVRLEALYEGGDPWTDLDSSFNEKNGCIKTAEEEKELVGSPYEILKYYLEIDGINTDYLDTYLSDVSKIRSTPIDKIITSALLTKEYTAKFKQRYSEALKILPIQSSLV